MSWDNPVSAANRTEAKACIYGNTHLDEHCPKGKGLLKISINSWDDQAEKSKGTALPAKANFSKSDQSET